MLFRSKQLIWNINGRLNLERAPWKSRRSSNKYTKEGRLEMLKKHLQTTPFITVSDYYKLTGLLPATATIELRGWAQDPESGITTNGRGSHKVYVKKTNI